MPERTKANPVDLGHGAWTLYDPAWLSPEAAEALRLTLVRELEWEQRAIVALGKEVMQPRLIAWAGELAYHYSGQTLEPRPVPDCLAPVLERVRAELGEPFNHVLLNRYRDGHDRMSNHADNEPELGKDPTIAAVSLGVTRRFTLTPKDKRDRRKRRSLQLLDGSLLVMGGTLQHRWRHAVPAMPEVQGERINLTFRTLRGPPGWRSWRDGDGG